MHEGSRETRRVKASEIALSSFPPVATANETKAPRLPREASHLDVQAAGTVMVTLDML